MQIQCVVFDMAGTTVNEDNLVYKTLQAAINHYNVPVDLDHVLLYGAGKEKFQAIKDIISNSPYALDELVQLEAFNYFLVQLEIAYKNFKVTPMPGAEEVFIALKEQGIKVVLNTGYNRVTAESLLAQLGWKEGLQIDLLVTASDVLHNRPMPDMILYAKDKLNIADTKQMVKIGDSCIDIEEGKNAGCLLNIGITTGAQTETQLMQAKPDYIVHSLTAMLEIIAK
ncbi:MAG: HAD family hydrolase [Chitinophagia bacterium]|jgi:phosphonatase-like hydrolase|nr:HAD family hydrolase [Chitinophagia bacterium]